VPFSPSLVERHWSTTTSRQAVLKYWYASNRIVIVLHFGEKRNAPTLPVLPLYSCTVKLPSEALRRTRSIAHFIPLS
jgi:hypothetical protein